MRSIEEVIRQFEHVCWYPSAGCDFRALLFLSDWYYKKFDVPTDEGQVLPDLFVMTDMMGLHDVFEPRDLERYDRYGSYSYRPCEPGAKILHATYMGRYTNITVNSIEELQDHEFSFDRGIPCPEPGPNYNSAFLLEVEVESKKYDKINKWPATVLYISVQNEAFIKECIIPGKIRVEYQVLVRYGHCGGEIPPSEELPAKIVRNRKKLGIRYLISNTVYIEDAYPDGFIEPFYSISGSQWSEYGAVNWYKV